MYRLMGVAALSLMLTQLLLTQLMLTQLALTQQIARHARPDVPPLWRQAVLLALVMCFVLGVAAAAVLSNAQPPAACCSKAAPPLTLLRAA